MRRPPYQLVPDHISTDTVECLARLLAMAKRGEIVGLAYAAMYKRKRYIVDTAGEAYRSPTFAAGMTAALTDHICRQIRNGNDS